MNLLTPFDTTAVIHSLSANIGPNSPDIANTDTVTIIEHQDNNNVVAHFTRAGASGRFSIHSSAATTLTTNMG